jgi:hypothetical protein
MIQVVMTTQMIMNPHNLITPVVMLQLKPPSMMTVHQTTRMCPTMMCRHGDLCVTEH